MIRMNAYCAFLRGVNIGKNKMNMSETCEVLKIQGLEEVSSVLSTGNLLFTTEIPQKDLREQLEEALSEHFQGRISLFVKSKEELEGILASQPFEKEDKSHLYVFLCEPGFEHKLYEEFSKITPVEKEEAKINGGIFFWKCPKGATLDSGFSKILGKKSMKEKFTSRNINTIEKVLAKLK